MQSGPPPVLTCFLQTLPWCTMFPKSLVQCQETFHIFLALKDVAGNCVRDLWHLPASIAGEFALEANVTFVIQVDSLKEMPTS